ncbi:spore germination protein (amino acid permease) [Bacillus mesophilus]|uniref:GerAB/ArcD/ProY family transporter n=1 Tax=Bacillus mesophilus TaxID=1808955 RepID=A0A6M0QBI0_9BACI|nr:GerAB/ArcD/ProY family transporter [Bacillus mesophilus]MBM7660069.1 spore germination protein (amino acid permease) [Bacillus mesophilus]NEY73724.1 GerAB/ArcD/ProY family transporter [Bacillus mesophilus]
MDKGNIKTLNSYHVIFLVQQSLIGVGLLSLPHTLAEVGYNLWYVPFIFGVVAQLTLIPMYLLGKNYPNQSIYEVFEQLLGKWVGKLLSLLLISYCVITVASVAEFYVGILQVGTLPHETMFLPTLAIFIVLVYIVQGGIKLVARFCIIAFLLTIWMTVYLQWGITKGAFTHLLPVFDMNLSDVLNTSKGSYNTMLGYELFLVYFPYIANQQKSLKHASVGIWVSVSIYTIVCFTSVVYFTKGQLDLIKYPVLNLYKAVELSFIERIETLGISIWVFLTLSTIAIYLWAGKKGVAVLFNGDKKIHIYLLGAVAFAIILLPLFDQWEAELYEDVQPLAGYFFILLPSFLLLLHFLKKVLVKEDG